MSPWLISLGLTIFTVPVVDTIASIGLTVGGTIGLAIFLLLVPLYLGSCLERSQLSGGPAKVFNLAVPTLALGWSAIALVQATLMCDFRPKYIRGHEVKVRELQAVVDKLVLLKDTCPEDPNELFFAELRVQYDLPPYNPRNIRLNRGTCEIYHIGVDGIDDGGVPIKSRQGLAAAFCDTSLLWRHVLPCGARYSGDVLLVRE